MLKSNSDSKNLFSNDSNYQSPVGFSSPEFPMSYKTTELKQDEKT
jgi:hypothetical protein